MRGVRKVLKRFLACFLSFIILSMSLPASAKGLELFYDNEYHLYKGSIFSLYVNDAPVESIMEPIIFNNRALVPLREVFEALGQEVLYDNITKEITVSGEKSVKLQIGNPIAYIDGKKTTIPDGVVPKLITKVGVETKTMVPVRFVSENVGLLVEFDEKAGAIRISNPKPIEPEKPKTEKITIKAPTITKKSGGVTQIKITLSKAMGNSFKISKTSSDVLYFDIENAEYEGKSQTEVNHGAVKMVRLGLHEEYTRVAVDTTDLAKYDAAISNDKKTITIIVTKKADDSEDEPKEEEPKDEPDDEDGEPSEDKEDEPLEVPETTTITVDVKSMMNYTPSEGVKYVVIDAGHGGTDPGAQGTIDEEKYNEKDINLSVAKMVRDMLEDEGIEVIMTRDTDKYPTLTDRSKLANSKDAAIFVSIHVNSAANAPKANGIEVYYAKGNNENYYGTTSKALATSVLNSMLSSTEAFSRGVKVESHLVTRTSLMPAILVELGFISNEEEIKKLIDEDYQELLAEGIVEGILSHYEKVKVPDRRELAEKMVAKEVGEEKAKEYIDEVWE